MHEVDILWSEAPGSRLKFTCLYHIFATPVSARRPSGHNEYGSVENREREGPLTPILDTSVVADQCKTEETAGGGEESEAEAGEGGEMGIRCGKTDKRGQEGQTELGGTMTTKGEAADVDDGSTTGEAHNTKHALRPMEG